jgi:hypothetical protein
MDRRVPSMIPHTIVLEPGLVIHKIYNGYWFFGRPTIEDLRQDLPAVFRIVQRICVFGNIEVFLNYTPGVGPERPVGVNSAAKLISLNNTVDGDCHQFAIRNLELHGGGERVPDAGYAPLDRNRRD